MVCIGHCLRLKTGVTFAVPCPGISFELHIEQDGYMSGFLSQKAGARVVIHYPYDYPMVGEFGMDLRPGTANSISVQMVTIHTNTNQGTR